MKFSDEIATHHHRELLRQAEHVRLLRQAHSQPTLLTRFRHYLDHYLDQHGSHQPAQRQGRVTRRNTPPKRRITN